MKEGMFTIEKYQSRDAGEWNAFVRASRNGTFLLERGYMDYHSDRFEDCSWVVRKGSSMVAVLPANITSDGVLHSHQGLTYGGLVLPQAHLDGAGVLRIFEEAAQVWRNAGIRTLDYKAIPTVYHRHPSQEDEYALWRLGARLEECTLDSAVDLREGIRFNTMQRRHLSRSSRLDISVRETDDVEAFMDMLAECLAERHGASPVHSAEELRLLRSRFPENIRIFVAGGRVYGRAGMDAGVCIYDTGKVAHAQYIATTPEGRDSNLLSPLFHHLMTGVFASRDYFDFGISTEDGGRYLNEGLLRQKYSYGATGVACRRFTLDL